MACRSIVLPVRGGATIRPRWPLPTGAIRSSTRDDMFVRRLELDAVLGIERREVVEEDLLARHVGVLEVDRLDLDQREVALPFLRRADLAGDGVAGAQVEAADLRRRDVDVVRDRAGSCTRARAGSRSRPAGTPARPRRRSGPTSRSAPAGSPKIRSCLRMPVAFSTPSSLASFERSGSFISLSMRMSSVSAAWLLSAAAAAERGVATSSAGFAATRRSARPAARARRRLGSATGAARLRLPRRRLRRFVGLRSARGLARLLRGARFGFSGFSTATVDSLLRRRFRLSVSVCVPLMYSSFQRRDAISRRTCVDALLCDGRRGDEHPRRRSGARRRSARLALDELVVRELVALGQHDPFVDAGRARSSHASDGPARLGSAPHVEQEKDQLAASSALSR